MTVDEQCSIELPLWTWRLFKTRRVWYNYFCIRFVHNVRLPKFRKDSERIIVGNRFMLIRRDCYVRNPLFKERTRISRSETKLLKRCSGRLTTQQVVEREWTENQTRNGSRNRNNGGPFKPFFSSTYAVQNFSRLAVGIVISVRRIPPHISLVSNEHSEWNCWLIART